MDPEMEYLEKRVEPVLEPLVVDILAQRPADVPRFICEWMQQHYGCVGADLSGARVPSAVGSFRLSYRVYG